MSDVGKVRLRVPSSIRAGDVIRVRCLVIHPMERVERDAAGRVIDRPYNYINRVAATYRGRPVVAFETTQSVSENPTFSFAVKVTEPGPLKVAFADTRGGRYEGTADIAFG